MTRGTVLEIRPAALAANARRARGLAPGASVYAMVKANAYGHGLTLAASTFSPLVDGFGVALMEEAQALRDAGVTQPLLLLEGFFDRDELLAAAAQSVQLVLHSDWQLALLETTSLPTDVRVWLKLDCGMHRLGIPVAQCASALKRLAVLPQVQVAGVMSHFACADLQQDVMSARQLEQVQQLAAGHGLSFSAANSAGLCRYPDSHGALVRPGIMLYGGSPLAGHTAVSLGLSVTQRLSARLIAVNDVPAGESVGYGAAWTATRPSRIGVVALGYGDGYPRHAPGTTPVAVNGVRTTLAGRVSMDMLTVDVTDIPQARPGDEVELWGDTVSVDEVAAACGTISYALFCQITPRVRRVIAGSA